MLNTIVAEAVDDLAGKLKAALKGGTTLEKAVTTVVKETWIANKRVVFDGDGYSEAWHKEAEKRGLANLKTTPDALPWIIEKSTIAAFKKYKVLTKRELEARYDVYTEQYVMNLNIEAETAAMVARTMLLPAAIRYLNELRVTGLAELIEEIEPVVKEFHYRARQARGRKPRRESPGQLGAEGGRVHARHSDHGNGGHTRGGRPAGEAGGRRPVAAAEVLGDAFYQVSVRETLGLI